MAPKDCRVVRMIPEDLPLVAKLAGRAYLNDPGTLYYFHDESTRLSLLTRFFENVLWINLTKNEENWVAKIEDKIVGFICVSLPSDAGDSVWWMIRSGALKTMYKAGWKSTMRLNTGGEVSSALLSEVPKGLFTLEYIGVDPEYHKQGIAALMINTMLEKADKNKWGTVLLTQNPKNVQYYERFGFKLLDQRTSEDLPPLHLMGRNVEKEMKKRDESLTKYVVIGSLIVVTTWWLKRLSI
jgi:GNAT superfamily N-acetyltransferase